jgi:4-amino-4-deoxy-L-arabinose transferase-like glycosyltransferase
VPQTIPFRLSCPIILALWIAALPLLLFGLGTPVVQRTQEARVLETAREMLDSRDWRQWMIPRLNGQVRLQKPPLAYWVAAGSIKVLGVNDFAGRLPFALAGWLTIAVV